MLTAGEPSHVIQVEKDYEGRECLKGEMTKGREEDEERERESERESKAREGRRKEGEGVEGDEGAAKEEMKDVV